MLPLTGVRVHTPALMPSGRAHLHLQNQLRCADSRLRRLRRLRCRAYFPNAVAGEKLGQLSCSHSLKGCLTFAFAVRASSTLLPRQGAEPTLLRAIVCEGQGKPFSSPDEDDVSQVLQVSWGEVIPLQEHHLTPEDWQGQLFHTLALVLAASSAVPSSPVPALLVCPDEIQGPLF